MAHGTNEQLRKYLRELTILCVDDESTIRESYRHILSSYFQKVILAKDGEEGLRIFEKGGIDLVLSDYMMPKKNGIELIRAIRKRDKSIPVILVTAMKESEILKEALNINTTHFLNKPIEKQTLLNVLMSAAKNFLAEVMLRREQERKIKTLEASREYSSAQERMAFEKELHIIRNDRYYELAAEPKDAEFLFVDICYRPLDVLSGDSFSVREIDEERDLYFIVDAMGKGISASTTAMLSTSFLNHNLDLQLSRQSYELDGFVREYLEYIQKFLLDDEMLSLIVVEFNRESEKIKIANFAMPPTLLIDRDGIFHRINGENLPVSKYVDKCKITQMDIKGFEKLLISSDGIYETVTTEEALSYRFIEEDFKASHFKFEFEKRFFDRVEYQDDDITFLMLSRLQLHERKLKEFTLPSTLDHIKSSFEQISGFVKGFFGLNKSSSAQFNYAFHELLMNAYEHGNLWITGEQKENCIEQDSYMQTLQTLERETFSNIYVKLYYYKNYLIVTIKDEGKGFDLSRLRMEYLVENTKFSGRGIKSSREMLDSLFYNFKSNEVIMIKDIRVKGEV